MVCLQRVAESGACESRQFSGCEHIERNTLQTHSPLIRMESDEKKINSTRIHFCKHAVGLIESSLSMVV